jgi:hypothetical protein
MRSHLSDIYSKLSVHSCINLSLTESMRAIGSGVRARRASVGARAPGAGLAGVSPPALAAVSFVVSFAEIRERPLRPTGHGHPRSRTGTACGERWGAQLESVLGATPQEFESPILRHLTCKNTGDGRNAGVPVLAVGSIDGLNFLAAGGSAADTSRIC